MKTEAYVCGFAKDYFDNVLMVKKNKPEWQKGKLNGIGGKIEHGESILAAMHREWKEETSLPEMAWRHFATITGLDGSWKVFFFVAESDIDFHHPLDGVRHNFANDIGEELHAMRYEQLMHWNCIPNIKYLLPMGFQRQLETIPDRLEVVNAPA